MTLKNTLQFIVRLIAENIPVPSGFAPMKSGGATATFHAAVLAVALLLSCAAGAESIQFLRAKAEQGDAEAQYSLGSAYYTGSGVPESDVEAVKWFRRAAGQGHAEAQNKMGFMHYIGDGVQKDYVESANWHLRAAKQGHSGSQFSLGNSLFHGSVSYTANGFSSMQEAYIWLSLAFTARPRDNRKELRDEAAAKLSRSELEAAQTEAVRRHSEIEEMLAERRKAKEEAESGN